MPGLINSALHFIPYSSIFLSSSPGLPKPSLPLSTPSQDMPPIHYPSLLLALICSTHKAQNQFCLHKTFVVVAFHLVFLVSGSSFRVCFGGRGAQLMGILLCTGQKTESISRCICKKKPFNRTVGVN